MIDEELKKVLDEQSAELAEIRVQLKKINRFFFWSSVWSWVQILAFVIPLILAYFFLMPLLKEGLGALTNPTGIAPGANTNSLNDLLQQYQNTKN